MRYVRSRTVVINKPEVDEHGYPYVSNDVQRTRLKVVLDDVPSTSTFREQQLNALSEIVKSLPQEVQVAVLPYVMALTDIPFQRRILLNLFAKLHRHQHQNKWNNKLKEAVDKALADAGIDTKTSRA